MEHFHNWDISTKAEPFISFMLAKSDWLILKVITHVTQVYIEEGSDRFLSDRVAGQ